MVSDSDSDEVGSSKISRLDPAWIARQISTKLLLRRTELLNDPVGLQWKMMFLDQPGGLLLHAAPIDKSHQPAMAARPRKMFSATVRCGASRHSWCTMAMPCACASAGISKGDRLAVPKHLAGIRREHAGHDLHQRRLAGAVLTHEKMHFSRVNA